MRMNSVEEARIEMEQILDSAEVLGQLQDSLGSPEAVATKDRLLANVEHLRSLSVGGGRDINLDEESVKLDEFDEQAQNGYRQPQDLPAAQARFLHRKNPSAVHRIQL